MISPSLKVVITGAGGRLGSKIAEEFVRLGAEVVPLKFDAAKINSFEKIIKRAAAQLKGIDILVNAAGVFYRTPLHLTKPSDWDEFFNVNLRAPFFLSKFAASYLKKSRPGRIINIADTYGASPSAGFVPYGVSKAGLIAMTKGLAKELAPGVLVNCVCPGAVEMKGEGRRKKEEERRAVDTTLLKRAVDVKDVVNAILFLSRNDSMTGQAIFVDGGKYV